MHSDVLFLGCPGFVLSLALRLLFTDFAPSSPASVSKLGSPPMLALHFQSKAFLPRGDVRRSHAFCTAKCLQKRDASIHYMHLDKRAKPWQDTGIGVYQHEQV